MGKLPIIDKNLIEYLESIYPDHLPPVSIPERELWVAVGNAHVVRHLRALYEQQNENILNN